MPRPELKSPSDLGIGPAPKAKPTPEPHITTFQRLKNVYGNMTGGTEVGKVRGYLTDAEKESAGK